MNLYDTGEQSKDLEFLSLDMRSHIDGSLSAGYPCSITRTAHLADAFDDEINDSRVAAPNAVPTRAENSVQGAATHPSRGGYIDVYILNSCCDKGSLLSRIHFAPLCSLSHDKETAVWHD